MSKHSCSTPSAGGVHTVVAYTYANAAERLAATGFCPTSIGKIAHQIDDDSFWILIDVAPVWLPAFGFGTPTTSRIALAAGTRNVVVYTVPGTRVGRFVLSRAVVSLSTTIVGAGSASFRLGTSAGGSQLVLPVTITSASSLGVKGGIAVASLGSDLLAANAYEAVYDGGQAFYAGVTVSGSVTGGVVDVALFGSLLPL